MSEDIQKLIKTSTNPRLIETVFNFAKEAYKDRTRLSGENYIFHATRVALILDKMNLDPTTVALGLLHDVLDDLPGSAKEIELKEIKKSFGQDLGQLIEKISELPKVRYSFSTSEKKGKSTSKEQVENTRRMFLAMSGDLRVILVELASRLDGLDFLKKLPNDKQKLFALETLQIFVPIASRLGLSGIRRKLEDTAFYHLSPERFKWVEKNIKEKYQRREKYLKEFIPKINKILRKEQIKPLEISYRVKSCWSTYKKLLSHNMDFNKIHDLLALRIIVPDIETCYKTLGVMHKHFRPISEEINDYIAHPKQNGYRSLHTTVFLSYSNPQGVQQATTKDATTEIQIRTSEMHKEAEYGVCAHWSYKERINLNDNDTKKDFEWTEDIPKFWKTFKINFFPNKVFVFTPKGDIITLPKNSTPVDFAYAVHSDVGNHCELSKINGKVSQLNHALENGDVVEIITGKNKMPSADWLRFVKTSLAKSHIKKLTEQKGSIFKLNLPGFIRKKIAEISEASRKKKEEKQKAEEKKLGQIYLAGQTGVLVHIAKCCNPQKGDKVGAYLTQNRSAVLHKLSCNNFKKITEKFPDKITDASWE